MSRPTTYAVLPVRPGASCLYLFLCTLCNSSQTEQILIQNIDLLIGMYCRNTNLLLCRNNCSLIIFWMASMQPESSPKVIQSAVELYKTISVLVVGVQFRIVCKVQKAADQLEPIP